MQDSLRNSKCIDRGIMFTAFCFTVITLMFSVFLSTSRSKFSDSGEHTEFFQDSCDDYSPLQTTIEQDGIIGILTCPWNSSITELSYVSVGITIIFIGSLCFKFCSSSKWLLVIMLLSGLATTGLLGRTFSLMNRSIRGLKWGGEDYSNYSQDVYCMHAIVVGVNFIIVGGLWLCEARHFLREVKRRRSQLVDVDPHIELAEEAGEART